MFTLAHELGHIWLGENGVSDSNATSRPSEAVEKWCNQVAAETLVPLEVLRQALPVSEPLGKLDALTRRFKVSPLIILRRIFDAGSISWDVFQGAYQVELAKLRAREKVLRAGIFT